MDKPPPFRLEGLTGREYKLLLAPKDFPAKPSEAAKQVWSRLPKILTPHLAEAATIPGLPSPKERRVEFRDTGRLAFDKAGYSLRLRTRKTENEVALKLRTGDIYVSGSTSLPEAVNLGASGKETTDAKFEEDIAPLEVQVDANGVVISAEPGIRSRFSRSTERKQKGTYSLERYSDAKTLFPTLDESLRETGVILGDHAALIAGPEIDERVFKAENISLKNAVGIDIALTLWYFDDAIPAAKAKPLRVVELSFQWDFPSAAENDKNPEKTFRAQARRAERLFLDMQRAFWDSIDRENSSKTQLGLPKPR